MHNFSLPWRSMLTLVATRSHTQSKTIVGLNVFFLFKNFFSGSCVSDGNCL